MRILSISQDSYACLSAKDVRPPRKMSLEEGMQNRRAHSIFLTIAFALLLSSCGTPTPAPIGEDCYENEECESGYCFTQWRPLPSFSPGTCAAYVFGDPCERYEDCCDGGDDCARSVCIVESDFLIAGREDGYCSTVCRGEDSGCVDGYTCTLYDSGFHCLED